MPKYEETNHHSTGCHSCNRTDCMALQQRTRSAITQTNSNSQSIWIVRRRICSHQTNIDGDGKAVWYVSLDFQTEVHRTIRHTTPQMANQTTPQTLNRTSADNRYACQADCLRVWLCHPLTLYSLLQKRVWLHARNISQTTLWEIKNTLWLSRSKVFVVLMGAVDDDIFVESLREWSEARFVVLCRTQPVRFSQRFA